MTVGRGEPGTSSRQLDCCPEAPPSRRTALGFATPCRLCRQTVSAHSEGAEVPFHMQIDTFVVNSRLVSMLAGSKPTRVKRP